MRAFVPLCALVLVALTMRDVSRTRVAIGLISRPAHADEVVAAIGGPLFPVRGRVQTTDGRAIGGASVDMILVLEGRTYPLAQGLTDDEGGFAFPRLPEGSYWLVARAPGRVRRVETVRLHDRAPDALTLSLGLGAQITGTVTLAAGRGESHALGDVVVRAMPDGGGEGPPYAARADEHGVFVIENLPAGSYRVEIAESGYEAAMRRAVPAPSRGLTFALRQLATVRGVVRNAMSLPAPDADVMIAGSGIWPARTTRARADGTFEIVGIPSGVYEVRARHGDEVAEPVAPLVLDPGDAREITLTVTPGATLEGRVVDAITQQAIPGAHVIVAEDALDASPRASVAEDGTFRTTGLLRRPHQVSARAAGYVPRVGALAMPGTVPVVVALDRQVALTGRVVDGHGDEVSNLDEALLHLAQFLLEDFAHRHIPFAYVLGPTRTVIGSQ